MSWEFFKLENLSRIVKNEIRSRISEVCFFPFFLFSKMKKDKEIEGGVKGEKTDRESGWERDRDGEGQR